MRYQFIQQHQGQFRLTILLRILEVSASAFYQWQKRPESLHAQQKKLLAAQVCELFEECRADAGA
jgi:putative transposase